MKQESTTKSRTGRSQSGTAGKRRNENKTSSNGSGNSQRSANSRRTENENSQRAGNGNNQRAGNGNSQRAGNSEKSGRSTQAAMGEQGQNGHNSKLEKFFTDQLKDIYYAEQKIVQAIPEMQEACTTDELKDAFGEHLMQTKKHVKRLERVFEILGQKPEGKKCEAIEGIVKEARGIIQETEEGTMTRDAALIMAAQKVEHYEIATYGGLVQFAITVGQHEAADILDRTLREEEDTDRLLTEIAENDINLGAEQEEIEFSWDRERNQKQEREGQNSRMEETEE